MINTQNLQQAKSQIISSKEKPITVKAQNLEFNRKILEYGKFDILLSVESQTGKDKLKQINSGLNHVMAKIAAKNKVAIGIDLKSLHSLEKKAKAEQLTKIKENIKVCRKAGCSIVLLNAKDKKDAQSFLLSLGASTQQTIKKK